MIPNFFLEAQENELLEQKTSNTLSAHWKILRQWAG
jgi:hypothetical protein